MEKYAFISNSIDSVPVVFGRYFALVHQKHIEAYGEIGADNIVNNIVETYKHIQIQMNNPAVSNNVLLVGKVQSGKTSNLELLTALAFDNGYNILVIYGGYDSSLLKQTTDRFMDTFDASGEITYDGEAPAIFTTDDSTQILSIDDEIMTDLLDNKKPVIFVSMKRPAAMKKINSLFKRLDKSKFKAFIIDDEGDQASLNTAKDKINKSSAKALLVSGDGITIVVGDDGSITTKPLLLLVGDGSTTTNPLLSVGVGWLDGIRTIV